MCRKFVLLVFVSVLLFSAVPGTRLMEGGVDVANPRDSGHDLSHTGHSTSTAPNTNNTIWNYTTGWSVYSSPAVVDGRVYFGSRDNNVYCLNATTGALIWSYTTGWSVYSSPAVADGMVFVGSYDYKVYCFGGEPIADADGPYLGYEGSPITFDASNSTDDGTIVLYEWDWNNDGTYDENTTSPFINHTWADDFAGTIGLRVTDNDGLTDTDTASVTVQNVAPTVNVGPDQTVNEGDLVSFSGSFTDLGTNDTHTYFWDFGDGSNATGTLAPTHAYADNGVYTVTLNVTDDDGEIGMDTLEITVNAPPVAYFTYSPDYPAPNQTVTFNASLSTPDGGTITSYAWNFDDGNTTTVNNPIITHIYNSSGTYNVALTITDSEGLDDTTWRNVPVYTHDIAITSVKPSKTVVGQGYSMSINVTVENQGDLTETFNVTVYYNETAITLPSGKNHTTITLTSGNSTTITFTWNTTGMAKGNYTIWAYATPVLGETDTTDNTLVDGVVTVTIPGDVDGDFHVDIYDIVKICVAYGSETGDPKYDANCDINCDGKIDIYDVVIACTHYGQKYP